jgi:hypothetical protein
VEGVEFLLTLHCLDSGTVVILAHEDGIWVIPVDKLPEQTMLIVPHIDGGDGDASRA